MKEEISQNNVLEMAELIVINLIKTMKLSDYEYKTLLAMLNGKNLLLQKTWKRKFFLSDNKLQIKPAPYFLVFLFTGLTSFFKFLLPTATRATYE